MTFKMTGGRGLQSLTCLKHISMWHQIQINKYSLLQTHAKGLFKYKKLPYGVASTPVVLQGMMDRVL